MSYAIFFDYNNNTYRIPVNPEQLEISHKLSTENYNILKLGEVIVPVGKELSTYSFETEFPYKIQSYVSSIKEFKNSDYWLNLLETWMKSKTPVRFIATNGLGRDVNTLVLIENLNVTEKAGEEGDKYIGFELIEYKEFNKKVAEVKSVNITKKTATTKKASNIVTKNPKAPKTHTVVSGDNLWNIAKKYCGDGSKYPTIFNANKGIIKNANLIYPGQKLVIP